MKILGALLVLSPFLIGAAICLALYGPLATAGAFLAAFGIMGITFTGLVLIGR